MRIRKIANSYSVNGLVLNNLSTSSTDTYSCEYLNNFAVGTEVVISETQPVSDFKIWIDPDEPLNAVGTEVVNTLSGNEIDKAPSVLSTKTFINTFFNAMHPVGSIYMSVDSTNPSNLFGGTWVQLKDRFLIGAGGSYSAGTTGGETSNNITFPIGWTSDGRLSINQNTFSGAKSSSNVWTRRTTALEHATGMSGDISELQKTINITNMPPYLAVYIWKRTA